MLSSLHRLRKHNHRLLSHVSRVHISGEQKHHCLFYLVCFNHNVFCVIVEDSGDSQSESENSVSDSVDDNDDSVAEISRSFRSRQELCEQLNVNHMIQRIFLITLDNSKFKEKAHIVL